MNERQRAAVEKLRRDILNEHKTCCMTPDCECGIFEYKKFDVDDTFTHAVFVTSVVGRVGDPLAMGLVSYRSHFLDHRLLAITTTGAVRLLNVADRRYKKVIRTRQRPAKGHLRAIRTKTSY